MKGIILYFSGAGNTKFVVDNLKDELIKNNCEVDIYSIEDNIKFEKFSYDFLILGFPKYFEYIPRNFLEYIEENLCYSEKEVKTMIISTGREDNKIYFYDLEQSLRNKNFKVVLSKSFKMPDSYTLTRSYKLLDKADIEKILYRSLEEIKSISLKFLIEKPIKVEISKYKSIIYKKFSEYKTRDLYKNSYKFSVSSECDNCNLCVSTCPSRNIENISETIKFRDNCIMCCRCVNVCPKNAILYKEKKYIQYKENINLIIR